MKHEIALRGQGGQFTHPERLAEARHFLRNGLPAQSARTLRMQGEARPLSPEQRKAQSLAECARIMGGR